MTYVVRSAPARRRPTAQSVDIAGTAWPVYKVEALAFGIMVFLGALALTSSLQVAVLTSAASTVVTWWSLMLVERRAALRS